MFLKIVSSDGTHPILELFHRHWFMFKFKQIMFYLLIILKSRKLLEQFHSNMSYTSMMYISWKTVSIAYCIAWHWFMIMTFKEISHILCNHFLNSQTNESVSSLNNSPQPSSIDLPWWLMAINEANDISYLFVRYVVSNVITLWKDQGSTGTAKTPSYPYRVPRGYWYCRGTIACVPPAYSFSAKKNIF